MSILIGDLKNKMTITIKLDSEYELEKKKLESNILEINNIESETGLARKDLKEIYQLLNNNDLKILCRNILKNKYLKEFNYEDLNELYDVLKNFFKNIDSLKEKIDISIFFEKGNIINTRKLKLKFRQLGRDKLYKDFNFKRLKELFENPPDKLKPQDGSSGNDIIYDKFIVRKYLYGIVQMVVNEMDLLIGYTGAEGMGKSCGCSQDMNLMYYLLKELGLITYKYNIQEMWFSSLDDFLSAEDKFFSEKFRILGLDEGNELNRQDWQDERVKTFFQRLRRERFNQRIKFICLPQLGELMTAIVLSRMNFIFNMYSTDDIETGTLNKGYCNFYIIPRTEKIYSPYQKREISRKEILDRLGVNLEDKKKHYKEIPKQILIKRFKKNYIWGFNKKQYDKLLKDSNKTFRVGKGIRLTDYQAYCYFISRPDLKGWKLSRKDNPSVYATLNKFDRALCKKFEEDPNLVIKYEKLIERKKERKKNN